MAQAQTVELKPDTLLAYAEHIGQAERAMEQTLHGDQFLWSDGNPERAEQVRKGLTIAQLWSDKRPIKVPDGLIHDWIGATRIPGTTMAKTLALVQDYDNHKNIYEPQVNDSKLIRRHGDNFQIFLRLLKKKIITVILDTYHDAHYFSVDSTRWCCRSYTTQISEVEDAGKPAERVQPPDTGYGFLWRLNSYWRFLQRDGGTYVQLEAISLTRDIPTGLSWLVSPFVTSIPKESLVFTLTRTRDALAGN